jgi:predicted aldo/keto reductase-like oxidoreductase
MAIETRPLGETGHDSSVLTFGAVALDHLDQNAATELTHEVLDRGVNHVDVAPQYGTAEVKLAPALAARREEVFLGCKTLERGKDEARAKFEASRERLGVDQIDLYQFHAVTSLEQLEQVEEGAYRMAADARDDGEIDHIGLTGHGDPRVLRAAIRRLDLDTVMFPYNYVLAGKDGANHAYGSVLDLAAEEGVGTIGIKAFAKAPWPKEVANRDPEDRPQPTWYEPFTDPDRIADCLRFAVSSGLDTVASAGAPGLVPAMLDAAESFEPMDEAAREELVAQGRSHDTPVPRHP